MQTRRLVAALAAVCSFLSFPGRGAEAPRRIRSTIRETDLYTLRGNTQGRPAAAQDEGAFGDRRVLDGLALQFRMTPQQGEDLDRLLRQQGDRNSSQFHKFLTPEEFGQRFGPNASDIAQVTGWLESQGFSNVQLARSRAFVTFEGSAAQARAAFHTRLHRYRWKGGMYYANTEDPQLPVALRSVIAQVRGLSSFGLEPRNVQRGMEARLTSGAGDHFLTPGDFATIYNLRPLYSAGLDGAGIRIAVVGQSDIQLNDIRAFRSAAGLAPSDPEIVHAGTAPGLKTGGDQLEADLDIEWAGSLAPKATVVFVTSTSATNSLFYAIDNNLAPIITSSYGTCELNLSRETSDSYSEMFKQANAQGITVITASGDWGAASCDTSTAQATRGLAADFPSSMPYVTSVGGTTFSEGAGTYWNSATYPPTASTALSYIPEVAWNDTPTQSLHASGGGASIYNAKPIWQTGPGVIQDGLRDFPDIALSASPSHVPYVACSNGNCTNGFLSATSSLTVVGGTSAGSPAFAGVLALLVQRLGPQGNINPDLYQLAAASPEAFHDITSGSNIVPCQLGTASCNSGSLGYVTTPGYDRVTGLGSVDAAVLVDRWTALSQSNAGIVSGPLTFVPVTPCRVADTRNEASRFGGLKLSAGAIREFDIPAASCDIPANAAAYALNVTVVPDGRLDYLTVWPSGQAKPFVSTLNSDGRIKANAAVIPAGGVGGVNIYATDSTHVVLDISGYFVPSSSSTGLQFFPLAPCRVADTREGSGPLGSPYLTGGQPREFPVLASNCGVPSTAQAYSLNITAAPRSPLLFVTAWPSGQPQPLASILNAPTGTVAANAALIPAGNSGSISAFASSDTDLVIDINGYFAPAGSGGNNYYALAPCRVYDTRLDIGSPSNGNLPIFNLPGQGCPLPANANGYLFNATVVPTGRLLYLTLWPAAQQQPTVSTLNSDPDTVASNMAIVPTSDNRVAAFTNGTSYLILDVFGYFAP